jgi:uncharacterized membrane protein YgdD (TMEM256/DUF423 family)
MNFISLGSLSAALAVILGAFAAHSLKSKISPESLATFQTGVQYHFYHSLGLIIVGIVNHITKTSTALTSAGWLMLLGIILFSGSLYILSFTGVRSIGIITPIGGTLFIVSWVLLAIATIR